MRPSPFVASVDPDKEFDPERHVAFGDIFLAKNMSPEEESLAAVTSGAGLPDRADQGWAALRGEGAEEFVRHLSVADVSGLSEGEGICGVPLQLFGMEGRRGDFYVDHGVLWLGACRLIIPDLLAAASGPGAPPSLLMQDLTNEVSRIAVMGPDSRRLLDALGLRGDQLTEVGQHAWFDIIQEPVLVCRSDFAGPHGYDFIIPSEPFNTILAVICSWGVRLDMNLLPVGIEPIRKLASEHGR
jgi:glycine cleavage system aminomethyltransferase T